MLRELVLTVRTMAAVAIAGGGLTLTAARSSERPEADGSGRDSERDIDGEQIGHSDGA